MKEFKYKHLCNKIKLHKKQIEKLAKEKENIS